MTSLFLTLVALTASLVMTGRSLDRDNRHLVEVIRITETWNANGYRLEPAPAGLRTKLDLSDVLDLIRTQEIFLHEWITDSTRIEVWFGINMGIEPPPRAGESPAPGVILPGGARTPPWIGRPVYIVRLKDRTPCEPDAPPARPQLLCYRLAAFDADTGESMPPGGTSTRGICPLSVPDFDCRD